MQPGDELARAKEAVAKNDRRTALQILSKLVQAEPRNAEAWLMVADLVDDPQHIEDSLRRVLAVTPDHPLALQRLRELKGEPEPKQSRRAAAAEAEAELDYKHVKTPAPRSGRTLEIVLMVVAGLLGCCVVTALLFTALRNLGAQAPSATPTLEDVTGVVYRNLQAVNAENFNAYMATIHPDSPGYDQTAAALPTAFEEFNLSYQISGVQVLEQSSSRARVAFVLTTRKITGPEFRDNVVTGVFVLRKDDGVWKSYDQEVENIEYLN